MGSGFGPAGRPGMTTGRSPPPDFGILAGGVALADRLGVFEFLADRLIVERPVGVAGLLVHLSRFDKALVRLVVLASGCAIAFAFIALLRRFIFAFIVHGGLLCFIKQTKSLPAGSHCSRS